MPTLDLSSRMDNQMPSLLARCMAPSFVRYFILGREMEMGIKAADDEG